jgi:predicted porin
MNKSIISLAIAASMAASSAVMAEDAATVYGNVHLSINDFDTSQNLDMTSNTSFIGVKGSEDLGDGVKAIYMVEFGVMPDEVSTLIDRDQFVGLQGGMGTVKFGTVSSNYKQTGGKLDPMYYTQLQGRGFLNTQSALHSGAGINLGRQTNSIQFESPNFGGMQAVLNTTVSGADNETNGFGFRYTKGDLFVFFDWIDGQKGAASSVGGTSEAATKFGGKWSNDGVSVSAQFESAEDRVGADYLFLAGSFALDKNNVVAVTFGDASATVSAADTTGIAVLFDHKMSKQTNVYAGYGDKSSDTAGLEDNVLTAGIRKKF